MHANLISGGVAAVLTMILVGCPPPEDPPPFDTTGLYMGTYEVGDSKQFGQMECDLSLELVHLVDVPRISNTFAGVATLEWDCIFPAIVREQAGIESDAVLAPVLATLNTDGTFSLELTFDQAEIPAQLLALIDTAGIEDLPLDNFSVVFAGTGTDSDMDGGMDSCEGTLDIFVEFTDAETSPIDIGGSFEATVVAR